MKDIKNNKKYLLNIFLSVILNLKGLLLACIKLRTKRKHPVLADGIYKAGRVLICGNANACAVFSTIVVILKPNISFYNASSSEREQEDLSQSIFKYLQKFSLSSFV